MADHTPAARPGLMPLDEALAALLARTAPSGRTEHVPTAEADGRVLAEDLVSALDVPGADNTSMDGYAVRAAEVAQAIAAGASLPVSQRIPAGLAPQPLAPASVARIFTGANIPPGADAVVMQEAVQTDPADPPRVRFEQAPAPGQWIRRRGEDIACGQVVLAAGRRLDAAALGLAASIGHASLPVAARPRVALFSTGDELVMPGQCPPEQLPPGAIYNSNRFFLRTLLRRQGCEVSDLGIVPDRREATVAALREAAATHDLVLTSGGVSVGEEDHIKPAVQALGSLDLWQIAIKPGKPFAHGRLRREGRPDAEAAHFIGLPGNPVSSFVTFALLVRPFLQRLQGAAADAAAAWPQALPLAADFDWPRPDRRREFLRARLNGQGRLELFGNQSSGVLTSVAWADGLVDNPPGQAIARGDTVRFLPLSLLTN